MKSGFARFLLPTHDSRSTNTMNSASRSEWPDQDRFQMAVKTVTPYLSNLDRIGPEATAIVQVQSLIDAGLLPMKAEWGTRGKNDPADLAPALGSQSDVTERAEELQSAGVYAVRRYVTEWERPEHWHSAFQRARRGH